MSLRHSICTAGRRATPLFSAIRPSSGPRALALAPSQSTFHIRRQTRLSSNIPGLTPPWEFRDMSRTERGAYERFGPSYLEHMASKDQKHAARRVASRAQKAAEYEAEYGSDWYQIMREGTVIKDNAESEAEAKMLAAQKKLAGRDAQKEMSRNFYEGLKESRDERMRSAMRLAAEKRAKF